MHKANFTYRFDLDRDYFIDISMRYQSILPFFTLLTIRPLIIFILMKKRDHMSWDIRLAYGINQAHFFKRSFWKISIQVAMTMQEFNFCFLFRMHDLAPYSGLYCDGPLCRMGVGKQYLAAMLAFATIGTVPSFLLILLRMHQRIIDADSKLKLSLSGQVGIILGIVLLLGSNVVGFYLFGRDCSNASELEQLPDLAWLKERGGTLFLFGPPGKSEFFKNELLILFFSIAIIAPFVAFASVHSMKIMQEQKLLGVNFFFICPLSMMLLHMVVDVSLILSPVMCCLLRFALIIPFSLESFQLSLIFLLKNPMNRKIIRDAFIQLSNFKKISDARVSVVDRNRTRTISNVLPQPQLADFT